MDRVITVMCVITVMGVIIVMGVITVMYVITVISEIYQQVMKTRLIKLIMLMTIHISCVPN